MSLNQTETIAAVATAPLAAGVAIIRLSGSHAWAAAESLCPSFTKAPLRQAHYGTLSHQGQHIDHALLLKFKGPASFTGQDIVEIHCHGGSATVQKLMDALLSHPHVRMAEAGEYTRRAVLNGKMDLTAAEGLADLIAAETEEQRKQALHQLDGALGNQFETWRHGIMALVAQVEAGIDFPDEELDILADAHIQENITNIINTLQNSLSTHAGERVRTGFRTVILGKPNAGKSTLTNLLTGKETAIVSPIAGTTRDVVETHLNIKGYPIILADTAGLRQTDDAIEQEGVRRATHQAAQADLTLAVVDAAEFPALEQSITEHLHPRRSLIVVSKIDATPQKIPSHLSIKGIDVPVLALNLTQPESLPPLLTHLEECIKNSFAQSQQAAQLTRHRHRQAVEQALRFLTQAQTLLQAPPADISLAELLAQDLREAATAIGTVTGHTGNEDVLDLVFSTFCIGK